MKEHPLLLGKDRSLVGILTDNGGTNFSGKNELTGVLLVNAGLIHRVGPNRIYVKMARRLAAKGFIVLRFDLSGIGDSGPRRDKLPATESVIDEVRQAMDYLEHSKGIKRFCCVGLCAGAAAAAQVSVADHRVRKVILVNPLLPRTRQRFLIEQANIYREYALFNVRSWLRFFFMKSNYRYIWRVVSSEIKRRVHPSSLSNRELQDIASELKKFFRSIRTKGVEMLIVYSEVEFVDEYLQMVLDDEYRAIRNSGFLSTERLEGADHLVTPLSCQEKLLDLISSFLTEKP